jgi:hypothetical protein
VRSVPPSLAFLPTAGAKDNASLPEWTFGMGIVNSAVLS